MEKVLANLLLSSAAVKAIVTNDVDWDVARQGINGPHIILFLISAPDSYTMTGRVGHYEARVQIDCRAGTAAVRRDLVAAVDAKLSGFRGVYSDVRFDGCLKEGARTRFDETGGKKWFQAQLDYRIWWAPA